MSYLKTAEGGARRPAPDMLSSTEEFPPLGGGKTSAPTTPVTAASHLGHSQQQQQPQQTQQQVAGQLANDIDGSQDLGDYGLTGILQIIRMTDPDLNTLALGYDLTNLGLSLNSLEPVYPTLCCPWSDQQCTVQPEYRLPGCYALQPPPLRLKNFQSFQLETLFYIFYSMPRDVLQVAAATELNHRDWRFHKEHKCWFKRADSAPPQVKSQTYERGNYWVFDPDRWRKVKREDFVLIYDHLEDQTAFMEQQKEPQAGAHAQPQGNAAQSQPPATQPLQGQHAQPPRNANVSLNAAASQWRGN